MTLTPEQFNKISTKDDVERAIRESEERLGMKIDRVLSAVDGIAKRHEDFEKELTANQAAHDRFEKRFAGLETHTGIEAPAKA